VAKERVRHYIVQEYSRSAPNIPFVARKPNSAGADAEAFVGPAAEPPCLFKRTPLLFGT
jgi:hypothetical protein